MLKLKSFYSVLFAVFLTVLYSIFLWIKNSWELNYVGSFFCISFLLIQLFYYSYLKWKHYKNDWAIIGRHKYKFSGLDFFLMVFLILSALTQVVIYLRDNESPDFSFYNILFLSFINLKQLNYHLIVKQNFVTIIENNYFEDYSKSDIKYVAIKNNNLAIALMKSDKVFNFPIEDFNENELEVLNQFIKVENLEENNIKHEFHQ